MSVKTKGDCSLGENVGIISIDVKGGDIANQTKYGVEI